MILQLLQADDTASEAERKAVRLALAKPGCAIRANSLTLGEAAKELGCTRRTVYNYIYGGKLHAEKGCRGQWLIPAREVRELA
jgi:excisionase family DNA binding protein